MTARSQDEIRSRGSVDVLLVDGDNRAGLAVARSLARHGISFALVSEDLQGPASHSRSVQNALLTPYPPANSEAFVEFLSSTIERLGIRLAIPVTDQALLLFHRYRSNLEGRTKLAMANSEAVRSVLEKRLNLELAKSLGVPCPLQFELQHTGQIPEMIRALGWPIVLKTPGPDGPDLRGRRVLYAHNESQLRGYVEEFCQDGRSPLFQQCAAGLVHNLCCFAVQGELAAVHEYHSIRRKGGVGVLRRIVTPLPDLVEHTRALMRALKWDGVAHVAFFVSHDGTKKWYMETNGRFWASIAGSVHAGWDLPYWVYRYFLHGEKPVPGEIKIGSRTCWHCGDLMALVEYFRGGEPPATGTTPGKRRAAWQYLSGFSPGIHSDVFNWDDPMPGVMEHWQLAGKSWQFMKHKLAGRDKPPIVFVKPSL